MRCLTLCVSLRAAQTAAPGRDPTGGGGSTGDPAGEGGEGEGEDDKPKVDIAAVCAEQRYPPSNPACRSLLLAMCKRVKYADGICQGAPAPLRLQSWTPRCLSVPRAKGTRACDCRRRARR